MKKQHLLKSMLLLCALVVGSGSVWADKTAGFSLAKNSSTPPIVANADPATTTITGSASETWNVEITGTFTSSSMQGLTNARYWQMGKSNSSITNATFSTSGIPGTIKSIVVNCASAGGEGGSLSATVGGVAFGTQNQAMPAWSSNTGGEITFSGTASGEIVITEVPTSKKACYIQSITVTYDDTKYTIKPGHDKTTYVTPAKLDFTGVAGLTPYVATAASGSGVTMTPVNAAVPANTPLLLVGTASTSYSVPVAASATAPTTNNLVAGDGSTDMSVVSGFNYILYSDGLFYKVTSGKIATTKAYLHLDDDPAGAHALDIIFEENGNVTGIAEVSSKKQFNGEYYNLAGQKVQNPTKGLYIVNGKKVIVK